MPNFMSESGPISINVCSDVELVSLICLRRLPTEGEVWAKAGASAAKLAIRSMHEFVQKNTRVQFTSDSSARAGIEFDNAILNRIYKIFINRLPSSDEEAHFRDIGMLANDDLVRRLMQSAESMVVDGILSYDLDRVAIRSLQVAANNLNFDLYANYYIGSDKCYSRSKGKILDLNCDHIDVLLCLYALTDEDLNFVREAASARWPNVDVRIHTTNIKVGVEDLEPFDIFITNNNFIYGEEVKVLHAAKEANCFTACWLWDNHHQFDLSSDIVHSFDMIFPAHSNGSSYLHSGRAIIGNVTPCCTFQWSQAEAIQLYQKLGMRERSSAIYGRFNSYPGRISFRDNFLTLAASSLDGNEIRVISHDANDWFPKTPEQKFQELSSYSVMLVSSIYNDVPARMFEALLVGAIPVVPHGLPDIGLSFAPDELESLPIVTYFPNDVESLREAWRAAVDLFAQGGQDAAERRHALIASHHMMRNRVARMVVEALDVAAKIR